MLSTIQQEAANHKNGPLLVLAGAGSGKTRVLTHRINHLISEYNVRPYRILVVTFTNKAAKEMKFRLENLIGTEFTSQLWIGTFHSICSRILRREIEALGYQRSFVIYDPKDQKKAMNETLKQLDLDIKKYRPAHMLNKVSEYKNKGLTVHQVHTRSSNFLDERYAQIYENYQSRLKLNNALDFDDLLLLTLELLRNDGHVLKHYQQQFQYLLVDEYQDTNNVQFELIKYLGQKHRNIFVVGDVDQSIYSFRNADFRIILRFQEDFRDAMVIKLEENYRSTPQILQAANAVIRHNQERFPKKLRATRNSGEGVRFYQARDEYDEVRYIIRQIERLVCDHGCNYGDIGVLYRTNAQSRVFEEALIQVGIPHQLVGSFRFYERKEVKDILAYLQVIYNPVDSLNLKRVMNVPKRGLGAKTMEKLEAQTIDKGLCIWDGLEDEFVLTHLPKKAQKTLRTFAQWIKELRNKSMTPAQLIETIVIESGYEQELAKGGASEAEDRMANIGSLVQAAHEFEYIAENPEDLGEFLNHVSLVSDIDHLKSEGQLLTLMTVHSAKGLEFPTVFVSGLEEGLFPHFRSLQEEDRGNDAPIEEERRLMYVALTRAQDHLFLSSAHKRSINGYPQGQMSSRFLKEIPEEALEESGHLIRKKKSLFTPSPMVSKQANLSLSTGDHVNHEQFGQGEIIKIMDTGGRKIAIIHFPGQVGKRVLDLSLAPLSKV